MGCLRVNGYARPHKGQNSRGIVARLSLTSRDLPECTLGGSFWDGVPDRSGGTGKVPICNRREQLGKCRIVEGGHEATLALFGSDAHMNESIKEIQRLLGEIAEHLRAGTSADTRRAVAKLERITALASTLALTVKTARR